MDNAIIQTSDSEVANKRLAQKLHSHNPPLNVSPALAKGDLVMIKSDKSKLHPRDTYLVEKLTEKNGCQWAELFKLGNKLVNKPQLVKVEDLIKVKQKRHAAIKAAHSFKHLVPYIRSIDPGITPKHPWD